MPSYGVLSTGFVDKPIETILAEIEAEQKATIDPGFDISSQSPAGQINGIIASKLREIWEVLQATYGASDPDQAAGQVLTRLAALTGTVRRGATKSRATLSLNLDAGVTVPAGSIVSVAGNPDARFVTLVEVTNGGGAPADFSVTSEAETAGVVVANAGSLTVIETSITGWNTSTNAADATLGLIEETDSALRIRRESELRQSGAASLEAILADLRTVPGVTSARVLENTTTAVDVQGLPPHSIEAIVLGGTDEAIAQQIYSTKAAGINAFGNTDVAVTDINGESITISFTRPTELDIYLDIFVTTNTEEDDGPVYPADGDTLIKTALSAYSQANLGVGVDIVLSRLYQEIFAVPGVVDITLIEAGFTASPSGTANLPISIREIGSIDTANIVVTST